jgi:hypothetical protein
MQTKVSHGVIGLAVLAVPNQGFLEFPILESSTKIVCFFREKARASGMRRLSPVVPTPSWRSPQSSGIHS